MDAALTTWLDARTTPEPNTGCWLWTMSTCHGYAYAKMGEKLRRVHRAVLEASIGRALRSDEVAMHLCDERSCVNPRHLCAGSTQDNVNDRVLKGRGSRNEQRSGTAAYQAGANHPRRTITPEQVRWAIEVTNKPLGPRRKGIEREGTWSWAAKKLGVSLPGLRDAARVLS